jgi:hypothetical protein
MDHLDVVAAFLNPEINDDDIYITLPKGLPEGLNTPKIIVRLTKPLYGLKQAPRLWHDDINPFLLSLGFTQSSANPNLYLRSDSILLLVYVDDISMSYPEAATKTAIKVKVKLSEKYKITNLGPARQFLGIEIHRDDTGISLGQKAYITTILKRFGFEHSHISKKYFRPGGMTLSEWTRSVRAVRDIPVADYSARGPNTKCRVAYRPPIAVAPFHLALLVSYFKRTLCW